MFVNTNGRCKKVLIIRDVHIKRRMCIIQGTKKEWHFRRKDEKLLRQYITGETMVAVKVFILNGVQVVWSGK